MDEKFAYLIDPCEVEHCLEIISQQVDLPRSEKPNPMAKTIQELIIEPLGQYIQERITVPLEQYIQAEYEKAGGHHSGTEAALTFLVAADDIVQALKEPGASLYQEHVNIMADAWHNWLVQIGWGAYLKASPFEEGRKQQRMDVLTTAMFNAWHEFEQKHKRRPRAKELWEVLLPGRYIQNKNSDDYSIEWKRPNGKEEMTPFKNFKNRYTALRKKNQKILKN